jgi:hypothetical protein
MKVLTEKALCELVAGLDAQGVAGFVSMVTATEPKMNKKSRETGLPNPYLGRVKRMCVRVGQLGASYENAVNNQRSREGSTVAGEFVAQGMWNGAGEHVSRSLLQHKGTGRLYVVFYPLKNSEGGTKVGSDTWTVDSKQVSLSSLVEFLPPVNNSSRQDVESPVLWRCVGIDNIVSITVQGEQYVVSH